MKIKTWQEHHIEMHNEDRQEWLQVIALSLVGIATGSLLAYLVQ